MRLGRLLALWLWALAPCSSVLAEGSADFDNDETPWNGFFGFLANDQAVDASAVIRVDILNDGDEKVCFRGTGSFRLQRPDGTNIGSGPTASGGCVDAIAGLSGAYFADLLSNQSVGTEWDIRVCAKSVTNGACLNNDSNERTGRVWSTAWTFNQNTNYAQRYSVNGSVFAVVPGGGVGRDAVIEMQMRGVSGAYYALRANSTGPVTSGGARVGRSVPRNSGYAVNAEYPLYLNPPEAAQYNWIVPLITEVQLTPACGTGVVLSRAAGQISFTSNVAGQYVVVCDVDRDSVFDFAGTTDFSSFGTAQVGKNAISWDGRNNAGSDAAEGTYSCIIRLNVGEFHYIAEDIETSYPGIRMYRVEPNRVDRTPLRMFWDDTSVGASENMPNGQLSPISPLADGLDPTALANPAAAFYFTGGDRNSPQGNARAWGDFDGLGLGKGNDAYLDQFSAADTAISSTFSVTVIASSGDADGDGLSNTRECDLGSDPENADTDGDGVNDGFEAPTSGPATDTDGDGTPDVLDADDDGDGIPTAVELGANENGDGNPSDAANSDASSAPDYLDTDSDDDGVPDGVDVAPTDPNVCRDTDGDNCDDCTNTGADGSGGDPRADGSDNNQNGQCDLTDPDDDSDGVPDASDKDPLVSSVCADSDGDTCDDCALGQGSAPSADGLDSDGDGACDAGDLDDDNDGVPDAMDLAPLDPTACHDLDADTCDDCALTGADLSGGSTAFDGPDGDHDGLCDATDPPGTGAQDSDGDGIYDADDADDDGDGILDTQENLEGLDPDADHDADGIPNFRDADDRGDGEPNACTSRKDPRVCDEPSALYDQDGDGIPNHLDLDSDGDLIYDADESGHRALDKNADGRVDGTFGKNGVADAVESRPDSGEVAAPVDTDDDGIPDFLDLDSDDDGVEDAVEAGDERLSTPPVDTDRDGLFDFQDPDDDDDGRDTRSERPGDVDVDTNDDGVPDYLSDDDDGDGIPSVDERDPDGSERDTDGDGIPDELDADDDGDGIPTRDERTQDGEDRDTDGDQIPDHLDPDDDGDGILTRDEEGDANANGVPDRLEPPSRGTLSGGALCSTSRPARHTGAAALALSLLLILWLRRRAPHKRRRRAGAAVGLGLLALTASSRPASAQVALDRFSPAPLPSDGFALSRPDVLARKSWATSLWLDYANDPLVYKPADGAEDKVVSQHLVGHLGFAYGVAKRVTLFATLPVHLLMEGADKSSVNAPKADGSGLGDLALGGRIQLSGLGGRGVFGSAIELIARAPTAELTSRRQNYSGDAVGSYEPALIGELRAGRFDARLRVGGRFRHREKVSNLTLSQEAVGGLGLRLRVTDRFYLHAESYGSTFMSHPFKRTATPLEALFGFKLHGDGWMFGMGAGPGLRAGYGSPDVRGVAVLALLPASPKAPLDRDGDGVLDPHDACPNEPEDKDGFEDQDGCPDPDNDYDGVPDAVDQCVDQPEDKDGFEDQDGCPDPDNDKDGVVDQDDKCPVEPEDTDGFEDQDGCRDPDNDYDGILDVQDICPEKPEDFDGFEDQDGCPEPGGIQVTCDRIEISEAVFFDTGKDTIQQRSFALLDQVASVLKGAPHLRRVRVAGHTDNRGNDRKNQDLSERRAASVRGYLIAQGVDAERLESRGYGESEPIADNGTAAGRAKNRRVEFQILDQSSECKDGGGP